MTLREYVVPGASGRDITVKLTDESAKRLGAALKEPVKAEKPEVKEAARPANKARTAPNKSK